MMVSAAALMADGFVIGGDFNYGKVSSDLTASIPGASASITQNTNTKGVGLKAGYQIDDVRIMATINSEKYSDDLVVSGEGSLVSYGVEADYIIDNTFLVGITLAKGSKDFGGTDIDFTDVGFKAGATVEQNEGLSVEAGLYLKNRGYDSYTESGITLDLDERVVGLYVGLSFNL